MEQKKTCTKCKQSKKLSEFYLRNGKPRSTCITCCKIETSKNSKKRKQEKQKNESFHVNVRLYPVKKTKQENIMEKIGNGLIYVIYLLLLAHIGIGLINTFYSFKIY